MNNEDYLKECLILAQNLDYVSQIAFQLKRCLNNEEPNLKIAKHLAIDLLTYLNDTKGNLMYFWEKQGIKTEIQNKLEKDFMRYSYLPRK